MSKWTQEDYSKAFRFASSAHNGQLFRGTELPYLLHVTLVCMEVIATLREEQGLNETVAVQTALLHDVLEDTNRKYEEIESEFGKAVAEGVLALTKDERIPKRERLQDSVRRVQQQPREIWMVKLADRITNMLPPPPDWSREKIIRYREDAIMIHDALKDASPALAARLRGKIEAYGIEP